jgi:hypothetical protein
MQYQILALTIAHQGEIPSEKGAVQHQGMARA